MLAVRLRFAAMADATQQVTAPRIADHELLGCVGRGSYGEVWLARNVMGTFRAVKIVSRQRFDQDRPFDREFAGIQKFEPISRTHPGLVSILHVGRNVEAGYFYYVMEVADDRVTEQKIAPENYAPRTLSSEIAQRRRLPLEECLQIGLLLTAGLGHLHQHGLVHRDIKPANIIFVNGVPKFADIGLVTAIGDKATYVGTEGYIPPEGPGSPAADLYSLGKVLYQVSMGKDCERFPELPGELRELREAPQLMRLHAVILKACEHDVRKRYQSAAEMQVALAKVGQASRLSRRPVPQSQQPSAGGPAILSDTGRIDQRPHLSSLRVVVLNSTHLGIETPLMEKLAERLADEGCELFMDQQPALSVAWARELESQIRQADAVLVLLSVGSVQDEMVAYGIEVARQSARQGKGKPRLLQVRFQFVDPLPGPLECALGAMPAFHWTGSQDDERLIDELVQALKAIA